MYRNQNNVGRITEGVRSRSQRELVNTYNSSTSYGYQHYTAPVRNYTMGVEKNTMNARSQNRNTAINVSDQTYVQGNVVRKVAAQPVQPKRIPKRKTTPSRRVRSKALKRPRVQADQGVMTGSYVGFLSVMAIVILISCVSFIGGRADVSERAQRISSLQRQVSDLKIENDAKYGIIGQKVNLEDVKERANQMGMQFMDQAQVITYESPVQDIMKQYESIPSSGVLAQSEKVFE